MKILKKIDIFIYEFGNKILQIIKFINLAKSIADINVTKAIFIYYYIDNYKL